MKISTENLDSNKCSIISLDYKSSFLLISESSSTIKAYQKKNDSFELMSISNTVPSIWLVKWYDFRYILGGTLEGQLYLFTLKPKTIDLQSVHQIHTHIIKEILVEKEKIITCGVDGTINILSLAKSPNLVSLSLVFTFRPQEAGIMGMALSDKYLLTQDENMVISFWDPITLKKKKQVVYLQDNGPTSFICRPQFFNKCFYLACTKSQINGEGCVAFVNQDTLQLTELGVRIGSQVKNSQFELKNTREIEVQGYMFYREHLIVLAHFWVFLYSISSCRLVASHELAKNQEINNFCVCDEFCLVSTKTSLLKIEI